MRDPVTTRFIIKRWIPEIITLHLNISIGAIDWNNKLIIVIIGIIIYSYFSNTDTTAICVKYNSNTDYIRNIIKDNFHSFTIYCKFNFFYCSITMSNKYRSSSSSRNIFNSQFIDFLNCLIPGISYPGTGFYIRNPQSICIPIINIVFRGLTTRYSNIGMQCIVS